MSDETKGQDEVEDTEGHGRHFKDAAVEADDTEGHTTGKFKDTAVEADDTEGHTTGKFK